MRHCILILFWFSVCLSFSDFAHAEQSTEKLADQTKLASDGFILGLPLVVDDISRNYYQEVGLAPNHLFAPPTLAGPEAIQYANHDTIYMISWLDLTKEPLVLSVPEIRARFSAFPVFDAWRTEIDALSTRATHGHAFTALIAGPSWNGTPPAKEMRVVRVPTDHASLFGRIEVKSDRDLATAARLQSNVVLLPLSAWKAGARKNAKTEPGAKAEAKLGGKKPAPPNMQITEMPTPEFFRLFAELIKTNPPRTAIVDRLKSLTAIGFKIGSDFDSAHLKPEIQKALEDGRTEAKKKLMATFAKEENDNPLHWTTTKIRESTPQDDVEGFEHVSTAIGGIGTAFREDISYFVNATDSKGAALKGENDYQMRFTKGALPKMKGFWSLTVYNNQGGLVENPIHRYVIGSHDSPRLAADGSLTIFLSPRVPKGKDAKSNWLPTPNNEPFRVSFRVYLGDDGVVSGKWMPPALDNMNSPTHGDQ